MKIDFFFTNKNHMHYWLLFVLFTFLSTFVLLLLNNYLASHGTRVYFNLFGLDIHFVEEEAVQLALTFYSPSYICLGLAVGNSYLVMVFIMLAIYLSICFEI